MKSYKLNKTLENSTYPIEQELKNLNKSTQSSVFKAIISVTTVIFSGIATSLIFEYNLFENQILNCLKKLNIESTSEDFILNILISIYVICIFLNILIYLINKFKEQPHNMKKSKYGRKRLSENFHKSIINDIVVGLSFVDKMDEEEEQAVKNMYLYEAVYYFTQAAYQIEQMKIFDDKKESYNQKLIDEIGKNTLLTTLIVFQNGIINVISKFRELNGVKKIQEIVEYKEITDILSKLEIHINLLKK